MKKYLMIFLFFCFFIYSYAQIPGYMGKRCTITYSGWAHPAIETFTDILGASNPHEDISLNLTQALEADYIVSKRGALCLGFQYSYLGLGYKTAYSDNDFVYKGSDRFPATLIARGFSIGYKLFARAKIAPVGTYIKWDIIGLFNTLKYSTEGAFQRVYGQTGYSYVPVAGSSQKINSSGSGLAFSSGRQRVFANKIIVDSGIRFAVVIAPDDTSGYGSQFSINNRVFYNQIVNLRLGIGFLAF